MVLSARLWGTYNLQVIKMMCNIREKVLMKVKLHRKQEIACSSAHAASKGVDVQLLCVVLVAKLAVGWR